MNYTRYTVQAGGQYGKQLLLDFLLKGLLTGGCKILHHSGAKQAPFRITFEDPSGVKLGILVYAFTANSKSTTNRPEDEHRFQVKYGSNDGKLHQIWQDPYDLYTTLMVGIDLERGIFVGVDPLIHEWTKFFISIEFKRRDAEAIQDKGWHFWEREKAGDEPVEIMVGGNQDSLLRYTRFERAAQGLDQGHRCLLAENIDKYDFSVITSTVSAPNISALNNMHHLAKEFEISETEILNLIQAAPRLKMAVRGWVAERHLEDLLIDTAGVDSCMQLEADGKPDFEVVYKGSAPILIECKNVLRIPLADGTVRVDFQKTRASQGDRCSRYYSADDFHILAACLHPSTENWDFTFKLTEELLPHKNCPEKLSNLVRIHDDWQTDIGGILSRMTS